MTTQLDTEFSELTTDDLMKAYAHAIEATGLAAREMAQKAHTDAFRGARLRLELSREACDALREALFVRLARREQIGQAPLSAHALGA